MSWRPIILAMAWTEIVQAVGTAVGVVAAGVGAAWLNGWWRRRVTEADAEKGHADALKTRIEGAIGAGIASLESMMAAQRVRIEQLERQLAAAAVAMEAKDESLRHLTRALDEAQQENGRLEQMIDALRSESEGVANLLRAENAAQARVIAGLERQLEQLEGGLDRE